MANSVVVSASKRTVLIVDSEPEWQKKLLNILSNKFEVAVASNYIDALEHLQQPNASYSVIITEISLDEADKENTDGFKLLDYLSKLKRFIPAIILTRYGTVAYARFAFKGMGVFDFIEKLNQNDGGFNEEYFPLIVEQAAAAVDVFVLMPFAKKYKAFYEKVIKKTVEGMKLVCRRVDDFYGPRSIIKDIMRYIKDSKFILADFSGRNPNVFFEVGISHAKGKSVLLLTQDLMDVPPKLQTIRCLVYESNLSGAESLRPILENAILEIQQENYSAFFPSGNLEILPNTCLALVPNNEIGTKTYRELILVALRDASCTVDRSDEIFDSSSVLDEIWSRINSAEVIIADLSGRDADVFYLAGLAFGLGKKIIYLAQDENDIPFDLKAGSHLSYSLEPFEKGYESQQRLKQLVKDTLEK